MFSSVKRVVVAGLTAAVVLGGAASAFAAEIRNVGERTFRFAPGGEVTIHSQNGRIVIDAWDKPQIRVQITRTVRAGDEARAKELMKGLRADVEISSNRLRIQSRYPKVRENVGIWELLGGRVAALQVHYYLQVPRNTSFSLETSNGEIRIRGTQGSVEAVTVNGDLEVTGVGGALELQTTNGEIRLGGIRGGAVAQTTNGGIAAQFVSVGDRGAVDLGTTNGNVDVTLPSDLQATFEANTTNGRVSISGFEIKTRGTLTSKSVLGTIGGGGARVALRTTNGNIDVTPTGSRRKR
jgi:DUF4097 and DUF4098 domain-containing protein YvlB